MAHSTDGRIRATVRSGSLGAGKTTLVNRLLSNPGDRRIAVILNDVGEVNVDARRAGLRTRSGESDRTDP